MTVAELREKTLPELTEELVRLRREQFNLRMQRASDQLPQTHLLRETRRDIARVNTVMQEKVKEAEGEGVAQTLQEPLQEPLQETLQETTQEPQQESTQAQARTEQVEQTATEEPQENAEEKADA